MKRSEILQIIKNNIEGYGSEEQAENILESIEKAGMLPPKLDVSGFRGPKEYVYKWESEEE